MSIFNHHTGPARLDTAGLVWFNELKNKYLALLPGISNPTPSQAAATAAIGNIVQVPQTDLIQQHVFDLEDWLVVLLPDTDLKQWVNSLRDDYREIFGAEVFQRVIPTLVPQVGVAGTADLQAEARRLQQELHWQSCIQPWAQRKRRELMSGILVMLILVLVSGGVLHIVGAFSKEFDHRQFVPLLVLLGALGGCISSIQRVQSADLANSRAMNKARYVQYSLGVALSPLQGAIFAVLLTLVLAAGVATPGFVVPNVCMQNPECPCPTNLPTATTPLNASKPISPVTNSKGASTPVTNGTKSTNLNSPTPAAPVVEVGKKDDTNVGLGSTNTPMPNPSPEKGQKEDPEKDRSAPKENKCCFPFFNMQLCFGSGKDIALLLIWAFISGFSERLVPDMLTRIADKGHA